MIINIVSRTGAWMNALLKICHLSPPLLLNGRAIQEMLLASFYYPWEETPLPAEAVTPAAAPDLERRALKTLRSCWSLLSWSRRSRRSWKRLIAFGENRCRGSQRKKWPEEYKAAKDNLLFISPFLIHTVIDSLHNGICR